MRNNILTLITVPLLGLAGTESERIRSSYERRK